jgi:hypothetical protein
LARHPWEITLREFIEIAMRDYGIEIELGEAAVVGGWILKSTGSMFPVLVLDPDEVIPLRLLRPLCKMYGIPPEDLGLDPLEDER